MDVKPHHSIFISKVTTFWCPTFQMENLKPSRRNALNVLLNCAAIEAEHGERTSGTLCKGGGSCFGELVEVFCLY